MLYVLCSFIFMALNSLQRADMLLRNYSLTLTKECCKWSRFVKLSRIFSSSFATKELTEIKNIPGNLSLCSCRWFLI